MVLTIVPVDQSVVGIMLALKREASTTWVSQVLESSWEEGDLLIHCFLLSPSCDDSSHVMSHLVIIPG